MYGGSDSRTSHEVGIDVGHHSLSQLSQGSQGSHAYLSQEQEVREREGGKEGGGVALPVMIRQPGIQCTRRLRSRRLRVISQDITGTQDS